MLQLTKTRHLRKIRTWRPYAWGNDETHYVYRQTIDRMYGTEWEPFVPELNKNVTYDKTITIKPTRRTYDRQDIVTPRTINESVGFFRPGQEADKVRTTPEMNGATGFFIPQFKRATFRYCSESISSSGVREFFNPNKENSFSKKFEDLNPWTTIYKIPINDEIPKLILEFCSGQTEQVEIAHLSAEEVFQILDQAANRSGLNWHARIENDVQTRRPSVQGQWSIFGTDEEIVKRKKRRKAFGQLKKFNAWDPKRPPFQGYYREGEKIEYPVLDSEDKRVEPRGPYSEPFGPIYVDDNE